ncbi:NAD(P)H-hydrate dehydratase [Myxococcota bacterium]|nr:NAD(P)H-hydrate dehydratase [Myxococcota bacterium]
MSSVSKHDVLDLGAWDVVSGKTMSLIEEKASISTGIPADLLMENAGRVVADCVEKGLSPNHLVTVVVGTGNNGGDGWVAARHLLARGVTVQVLDLADKGVASTPLVALNKDRAILAGVRRSSKFSFDGSTVIVDALLGTGTKRSCSGLFARAISAINRVKSSCRIVAVDLPSGIDASSGRKWGEAVIADETICLTLPKVGLLVHPGKAHAGEIKVGNIGLSQVCSPIPPEGQLLTSAGARSWLPKRTPDGHKGDYGHVLVVGGGKGKIGAAILAAKGAFGIGAGLVTVGCGAGGLSSVSSSCCEAMTISLAEDADGNFDAGSHVNILAEQNRWSALLVGPGLGRGGASASLVQSLARNIGVPAVFDADALHAIAMEPECIRARNEMSILTPHPGEAAALLGTSIEEINSRRVESAREIASNYNAIVLLKGATSLIATSANPVWFNWSGGPILSTAGTGDVLAGVVAGLLAQGLEGLKSAVLGAYIHGICGDQLSQEVGSVGIRAGKLAEAIPNAMGILNERKEQKVDLSRGVVAFPES